MSIAGSGDGPEAVLFANPPPALGAAPRNDADALVRRILDGACGFLPLDAVASAAGRNAPRRW